MFINAMGMTSQCYAFNTLLLFDLIAATLWFITKFYGKLEEVSGSLLCVGQHGCQYLSGLPELEFAEKKKKPFNLQFFLLRTVLEMLLPNTCNRSLIHQKKITAFWEVSLQNRLLSIRLLSLLLIPEDFVEANGYLSCLDPQYGVYCPHLCSAEFPFSFRFIAPLMTSWSNSGTFQLRLVTRTVHSKV